MSTAVKHRQPLTRLLRPLIAGVSLVALLAAAGGAATSVPATAQTLDQSPRPDPDGEYGANLPAFEADGPLVAVVALGSQQMRVFDRTGMVASTKVSTGRKGYETPEGIFSIIERKVEHTSNLYDDASMPFMQRLTWSGIALHEGHVPGHRASHGCIRLPNGFAERLFRTTRPATRVVIASHDATPEPISHPILPQPGDTLSPPAAQPTADAQTAPAGPMEVTPVSASAEDAAAVVSTPAIAPAMPTPNLAELRARRIAVERRLSEATKAVERARIPVRPRLIEQGKTEKALRQAIALANRAAGREQIMAQAVAAAETDAGWSAAAIDHMEAQVALVEAKGREDWAREVAARAAGTAMAAQDVVRKLDAKRQRVLNEYRSIARRLSPFTIFVSRDTGSVFVHQAFHPIMELPVTIREPDRRLGTHIFTAMQSQDQDDAVSWVGMTLETPEGGPPAVRRDGGKRRSKAPDGRSSADGLRSARAALDRIELPQAVLARIMPTLQPGSTLIISDLGKSIETGPGTDIVVQTRGEEAAKRSIASFVARKRGETLGFTEYRPRRRERLGDWERW